jgi:hypothetical protein
MTIIQEIQEKLMTSTKPVARLYYKSEASKTMFIGFNSGMVLDQHKTSVPARLMVLTGKVTYQQGDDTTSLCQYETKDISKDTLHEVYADEDSLFMSMQG